MSSHVDIGIFSCLILNQKCAYLFKGAVIGWLRR